MFKKIFLLLFYLLLFCSISLGRAKYQGIVEKGGKNVKTSTNISFKLQETYPTATVMVYKVGTTTLVPLFSDNAGTTKANPFFAASDASYSFYADNGRYDIKFSGVGLATPFTISDIVLSDPNSSYVVTSFGAKCDGTTNDTTALSNSIITAALAGGEIVVPLGTCVTDSLTISTAISFSSGGSLYVNTGQTVIIQKGINDNNLKENIFKHATAGLGTITFTNNHKLRDISSEWWGAIGDSSTNCFAAIQAAEKALETLTSGSLLFNAGDYHTSAAIQIFHAKGIKWVGAGPDFTRVTATGGAPVVQTVGMWRSRVEGIFFTTSVQIAGGRGVFELDGETDGSFGTQGNTFIQDYFDANHLANHSFIINRLAGSAGQGSENFFLNDNFSGGMLDCYYQTGFNALNNTLKGGNFQNYAKDGISIVAGSISVDSIGFQYAYSVIDPVSHNPQTWIGFQVLNNGWDIHIGEAGAGEKIVIQNCRTESLQFFKGSATQSGTLIGNTQNTAANTAWSALSSYHLLNGTNGIEILKQINVSGSTVWRLYTVTIAGTSGAVEPTWPNSGTIVDGTVTWTQIPFYSTDTISISGDGAGNISLLNNNLLAQHIAGWNSSDITAEISTSFTIARENLSFQSITFLVDASAGNVTITTPKLPQNTIIRVKKVETSANTVTLAGTGGATIDLGASAIIPGGTKGYLTVQMGGGGAFAQSFWIINKSF